MATVALLENEVKYMRCALCDNYLSVPPIMTISDDGNENQCGRCQHVKSEVSKRNVCYENLARFLHFPCIYRNCPDQVQWNEVEEHEKSCHHKTIQCPLYYQKNCADVVEISEFEGHMNRMHRNNMIYGETVCKKISNNMSSVYYVVPDEGRFIVYITPEVIFVGSLGSCRKYSTYTVKMMANDCEDKFLFFDNVRIVDYDDRSHCYKCLKEKCHLIHHPFSGANENTSNPDYLQVDKELVARFLHDPAVVSIALTLLPKGGTAEASDAYVSALSSNSSALGSYLRCVACEEYMTGMVFQCDKGHLSCEGCQAKEMCDICEKKCRRSRCYIAEELANCIVFNCLGEGCSFIGGFKELALHEQTCYRQRGDCTMKYNY